MLLDMLVLRCVECCSLVRHVERMGLLQEQSQMLYDVLELERAYRNQEPQRYEQ